MKAIRLNFKDIRASRQNNNNKLVYDSLRDGGMKYLMTIINTKELERTLQDLELTIDQFVEKCRGDHYFCKLTARHISKCSSRQGSKDETEQLITCDLTTKHYGVRVINLSVNSIRPTKDGKIYTGAEVKNLNIAKDCCLKSFDAVIEGRISGYISAKVAFGNGGHQDNVFEEMDVIAEWWKKYKAESSEFLVLLIDTDLTEKFNRVKEKYSDVKNILVCDHYDFQNYVINL